ncbi:MAG: hypothetical protein EOP06_09275 [Proteobacteria bacterium]|nr:MAG: hypothetical protein EOP06_09275 [Pseudomonadota bacterium]
MEIQEFSSFIERKIKSEGWDLYINHVPSHIFTGGDKDLIVDFDLKKVVMTRTDKWPDWILEAIEAYAMFSVMNGNNENATFVRHLADRKDYAKGNYLVKKRAAELISEHCLDDYLSIEAYTKEANLKIFSLAVMASKIEKEEGVTVTVAIAAQSIELFPSHFNYDIDSIPSEYLDLVHNLPIYVRKEAS